jgi:hypothetical protein
MLLRGLPSGDVFFFLCIQIVDVFLFCVVRAGLSGSASIGRGIGQGTAVKERGYV